MSTFLLVLFLWIFSVCLHEFAHAAVAKLSDRTLFAQHLAAYGLPHGLLPLAVWLIPLAEAATAVALLTPARAWGAAAAAALLLAYGAVMAWHRAHGRRLDCGCWPVPRWHPARCRWPTSSSSPQRWCWPPCCTRPCTRCCATVRACLTGADVPWMC